MSSLNPLYSQIPDNPNLVLLAEKILDRIHSNAVPILKRQIEQRDIVLTEKLLKSLNRHVHVKYQDKVVEWVLEMDTVGQFSDAKRLKYIGRPNADDFLEWVEKGFEKGTHRNKLWWTPQRIPGYKGEASAVIARIGELKALKRIASATIVKMGQTATVTRPSTHKGWFKAYFEEIVSPMNRQLEVLAEAVAMKESEAIIKKIHKI